MKSGDIQQADSQHRGSFYDIMSQSDYLRIENAEGYVLIAVYLFIYLYACSSHNKNSFKPNRMKFGVLIGYYPGTIWLDFGINRVKVKVMERSKSSFYHSTVNFYPIGMQLIPKCS